jgi:hypothetical protein
VRYTLEDPGEHVMCVDAVTPALVPVTVRSFVVILPVRCAEDLLDVGYVGIIYT